MPYVKVRSHEPFDVALRRFKRSCEKAGILTEVRNREFYEKPTTVRKRKKAAAVKRAQKKSLRDMPRSREARNAAAAAPTGRSASGTARSASATRSYSR